MDLSIIIVNYNASWYLNRCLASIFLHPPQVIFEVIVIDNNSRDDSVRWVRQKYPQVRLFLNEANVGFAKANNQGFTLAQGRYYLCLNNDTLVLPGALDALVSFLDHNPPVGAVGSKILNPDLSNQGTARRFPTPYSGLFGRKSLLTKWFPNNRFSRRYLMNDQWSATTPYDVDWLSTASMLIRKTVIEQVGGMDESFFYWVDAEWCFRIKKSGWQIKSLPQSVVIHEEEKGSGYRNKSMRNKIIVDFHRGVFKLYKKHYDLGPGNILGYLAVGCLSLRALFLIFLNSLRQS